VVVGLPLGPLVELECVSREEEDGECEEEGGDEDDGGDGQLAYSLECSSQSGVGRVDVGHGIAENGGRRGGRKRR